MFVTAIVTVIFFLIGLSMAAGNGFYVFQKFDDYFSTIPLLVIALFQCIGVEWIYGNVRYVEIATGRRMQGGTLLNILVYSTKIDLATQ